MLTNTNNTEMLEERISAVMDMVHAAKNFDEIMIGCKDRILGLVNADRLTLYAVDSAANEIYSRFFTGDGVKEIRVPISPESLSGYAASAKKTANIKDAYNEEELKKIDPSLSFNRSFDQKSGYRTKQVLVTPMLFKDELVGVIQLINKRTGDIFTEEEKKSVEKIASKLAIAFRNQIERMLKNRFGYLVIKNICSEQDLDVAATEARPWLYFTTANLLSSMTTSFYHLKFKKKSLKYLILISGRPSGPRSVLKREITSLLLMIPNTLRQARYRACCPRAKNLNSVSL